MGWPETATLFDRVGEGERGPTGAAVGAGMARLCVLGSGSSGNCSVLRVGEGAGRRTILIDAGLGTRTTAKMLAGAGVRLHEVSDVLLTHLDTDHWKEAWLAHRDFRAVVHLHRSHWAGAESLRRHRQRVRLFDGGFEVVAGVGVEPLMQAHDEHGAVAYRLRMGCGDLGFATDVGRATRELVEHLRGVSVLAIESNYCPRLQEASDRPRFLKDRIMGGRGHLSNEQCAEAAGAIGARHVVLLHLSRQCNRPELALAGHAGRGYAVTVTSQREATGWIGV